MSDVVVIGAGTAGSAAAAVLAPQVEVTLLDRSATPSWRVGETLPSAAWRVLTALGAGPRFAAAGHAPAPLKISRWGSNDAEELDSFRDPDGLGWRLDRARFEADLRANAVARGARLLAPCTVTGLERSGAGWRVALSDGGKLKARVVITACGRRSRLMQPFGQRAQSLDRLACTHQLLPAFGSNDSSTYTEAARDGWWYTAVLPSGWRIVAFHGDSDQSAIRAVFRDGPACTALRLPGVAAAIGDVDLAAATRPAFCCANSVVRSAAGPGWFAAGDNTMALDPLSSQGLFNALVTGLQAGESALRQLAGDVQASADYAARIANVWRAYLAHHALYYGMEERWVDSPFWRRRRPRIAL